MPDQGTNSDAADAPAGRLSSASGACGSCAFKPRCLPAGLEGEALQSFERAVSRSTRPLKKGQVLVRQDDALHALHALRVGSLKAIIQTPDGSERVVAFRFPGQVIGLAEAGVERWARSVVALEDSWLCRIPVEILDDDSLQAQLVALISDHLRREYECHLALASKTSAGRLVTFLLDISENHRRRGLAPDRFILPMSLIDIASYLGMRHESVCRALSDLQHRGLIDHQGKRFVIPDLEALKGL